MIEGLEAIAVQRFQALDGADRVAVGGAQALALELDERTILPPGARIASNLPYNVGTGLLIRWLTSSSWPPFWSSLTLMFQREVAAAVDIQRSLARRNVGERPQILANGGADGGDDGGASHRGLEGLNSGRQTSV